MNISLILDKKLFVLRFKRKSYSFPLKEIGGLYFLLGDALLFLDKNKIKITDPKGIQLLPFKVRGKLISK